MEPEVAIKLVNDMLAFIASFEGDVPGATEKECGNFREQDLEGAKAIARKMIPVLKKLDARRLRLRKIANVRHAPVSKGTLQQRGTRL